MGKEVWKAGNMLNPVPAVMVSVADKEGNANILTVAWAGTICTNPPMLSISVRPERYSYHMIKETNEFVVNLTTKDLVKETDFCGVKSGKDVDKFKELGLTKSKMEHVSAPGIAESPVNIECKVRKVEELGSHHMFIADVVGVVVDDKYFDETNRFHINDTNLIMYSHGEYFALGEKLGKFGYSIKKNKKAVSKKNKKSKNNKINKTKK
ncbi:flavin reductase family protein [Lachnobacterium bovis]|uniref:NADH-FMN oxidoreductase RutF, flavin reductase (DIM6/NTAB) family n=1 Tax=Lachnobacterium bovis TaxID=140626 RepID=A0A1H9RHL2_9FIRM|nr:flavin reductase family protein [Lachnobacterium bovis]SER72291.1 NADH-FMN oxidoreductase RutF, flavin reductase (DIM6/NTAB) family [Lachnobacterium bovis]